MTNIFSLISIGQTVTTGGDWVLTSAPVGYGGSMDINGSPESVSVTGTLPGGHNLEIDESTLAAGAYVLTYTVTSGACSDSCALT